MAYIGQTPSAVPLDGSDIADDIVDSQHYAAGSIDTAHLADDQITLAKMAAGTDGNIISYDASGNPVAIATGTDGQVLTSTGAGSPPAFEAIAASGLSTKVLGVSFNMTTASGTLDVTGAGFDPTALLFAVGTIANAHTLGVGVGDSAGGEKGFTHVGFSSAPLFNNGTSLIFQLYTTGGSVGQNFTFTFITDGIRLSNGKSGSPTGTATLSFMVAK